VRQDCPHHSHVSLWNSPIFPTVLKTLDYVGNVGLIVVHSGEIFCFFGIGKHRIRASLTNMILRAQEFRGPPASGDAPAQ
jgi:hypothetical protein